MIILCPFSSHLVPRWNREFLVKEQRDSSLIFELFTYLRTSPSFYNWLLNWITASCISFSIWLRGLDSRFILFPLSLVPVPLSFFSCFAEPLLATSHQLPVILPCAFFWLDRRFVCDTIYNIMLVVLDTNVLIAGLYSKRGASYQLLRAAISGDLSCAISPLVAFEYEGKIHQKIDDGFLSISKGDCGRILDAFFATAKPVWRPLRTGPVLRDPSDNKILECAISGHCTHLITFNKRDFPATVTRLYGIKIMTPGEFLRLWRNSR